MTTNIRCVNLRPHEVRRLLEVGSVRVVRPIPNVPPHTDAIRDVPYTRRWYAAWAEIIDAFGTIYRPLEPITEWLCPFGAPGDTVRVREAFSLSTETMGLGGGYTSIDPRKYTGIRVWYRADNNRPTWAEVKWRSPATMPAWSSRLSAVVDDVRACRVQQVTEAEAIEAGAQSPGVPASMTNRGALAKLHNKYTRDPAAKYDANPYVWNALITRSDK